MRQYKHKRPKYRIPGGKSGVVKDNMSHDGFRLHCNPDNTWVFLEGRRPTPRLILSGSDSAAINACAKRRGVTYPVKKVAGPHFAAAHL